jgi:hypothetical protein
MRGKIQIFSVIFVIAAAPSAADSVEETAKCAATFRVLTSIEPLDAGLGQYFTSFSALAHDMIGFYSNADRGAGITNGETSRLIADYQISIDQAKNNGEAFIPYVASCMGWAVDLGSALASANESGRSFEAVARASARPSINKQYPFDDWPMMQDIFYAAYAEWVDMGKVTTNDIRRSLGLQ